MSTTLAKTYLANYEALLKSKDEKILREIFGKFKMVQFNKVNFEDFENEEYLHLYLGLNDNKLQAILVKETDVKNGLAFENGKFVTSQFLETLTPFSISDKNPSSNPNRIFQAVYDERVSAWNKINQEWVTKHNAAGTLVKYFKISALNFKNSGLTNFVFGYKSEMLEGKTTPMIDLIAVTSEVFADLIKPVPPFKPGY